MKYPSISVLQNLQTIRHHPFPYVSTTQALPERVFAELEETFPTDLIKREGMFYKSSFDVSKIGPDGDIGLYRYKSVQASEHGLPPIWRDFFDYHTSEEFFRGVVSIFEESIGEQFPQYAELFQQGRVGTRGLSNDTELVTDCQFVVNDPIPDGYTSKMPHLDNPVEIYAALLYMRQPADQSPGGNLQVYRATSPIESYDVGRDREVDGGNLVVVDEVPYARNSLVLFLNTLASLHSVGSRTGAVMDRRSINIIGEFRNGPGMWVENLH